MILIGSTSLTADDDKSLRITPTVKAVHKVLPSVVSLSTEKLVERTYSPWDDFYHNHSFLEKKTPAFRDKSSYSLGSGSIIDSAGIIITNAHVVRRALRIHVTLSNGQKYLAKEIASTDTNDIALLKIVDLPSNVKLQPIEFAKAGDLLLGEPVIAVGNPYGLGNTITRGVLSAIGRKVVYQGKVLLSNILQTDAAINPGNSGGPLINIDGNMIGVNLAMHKDGYGIGFAVPLERAETVIGNWLIPERFSNSSLGLVPSIKKRQNGNVQVYIKDVINDSPAWKAGIRPNEIVSEFDGHTVTNLMDLSRQLWRKRAGETVSLQMANGKHYNIQLEKISFSDGRKLARIRLGLELHELTPPLAAALGYPFNKGIIIGENLSGNTTLKRGNILVRLGDVPIYNYSDIARAIQGKRYGDHIRAIIVSVLPKDNKFYLIKKLVNLSVK